MKPQVLYEDNHVLGVFKPAGVLVQGDRTGDVSLLDISKSYIKQRYNKPGKVFLGLVHRIDRPVSGVMVFGRTSKAASRLTAQFRTREAHKVYYAIVEGEPGADCDQLISYIERVRTRSRVMREPSETAKESSLSYEVLERRDGRALLRVVPDTGRHHQIRLQLSEAGYPIVGDLKYGAPAPLLDRSIALHAGELRLAHPTQTEPLELKAGPVVVHAWEAFSVLLTTLFPG